MNALLAVLGAAVFVLLLRGRRSASVTVMGTGAPKLEGGTTAPAPVAAPRLSPAQPLPGVGAEGGTSFAPTAPQPIGQVEPQQEPPQTGISQLNTVPLTYTGPEPLPTTKIIRSLIHPAGTQEFIT